MSDEPSPAPVREGDVLAKKYRVEKVLGIGGMGVVVSAMHLQLERRVALKFLLPTVLFQRDVVARFAREARAAAQIKSEHVARVIDVGELDTGSPYMVMEFLEGEDLAQLVEKRGALPVADVVGFVLQACDALAEAHALGIVHRDLKPANLFLAKRPDNTSSVKVLDFGISKVTSTEDAALTNTRAILGSPYYMSPEQLLSTKNVDARSDVWALGVILYELLTGTRPFDGESMPALVAAIIQNDPPPLSEVRSELPGPLRGAVMRCLEKERENRFASVAGLANALAPFAPDESLHLPNRISRVLGEVPSKPGVAPALALDATAPMPSKPAPVDALERVAATSAQSSWGTTHSETPSPPVHAFPTRAVVGVATGLLALAGITFAILSGSHEASTTASAASASVSASASVVGASATVPVASAAPASAPVTIILVDAAAPAASSPSSAVDAGAPLRRAAAAASPTVVAGNAGAGRPAARPAEVTPPPEAPTPAQPPAEPANKMKMEWK